MSHSIRIDKTWRLVLHDFNVSEEKVLRCAALPVDLFSRDDEMLSTDEYLSLWNAFVTEVSIPDLPLVLGQAFNGDAFSPPIFAALCSLDLNTAAERLSQFKRLMGPFRLDVDRGERRTSLTLRCLAAQELPHSLGTMEMVFLAHFARLATRAPIQPLAVTLPYELERPAPYRAFFGVEVGRGAHYSIDFDALDARRPFLTGNERMWAVFEPELRRRLAELVENAAMAERVEVVLVRLLPSGRSTLGEVARELGMSPRSLQRRLGQERVRYQDILERSRERLARHYLKSSAMSGAEIGMLLGYDDPNSFFRAFHKWTGTTPGTIRAGS
jgi:AraC-like DNA-binding protein